ncbi:hypothetical protein C7M84_011488 [Penaeus vannamei]|uniref:Uncharacterized protein n=1 Tax=Penaeus vannamei TaxID=6689 RepID=A0A423UA52_PENVA|nr:hypothetical protein C7M84_011488 [Penaeus vannamei]
MKFLIVATLLALGVATASSALVDESEPATAAVKILGGYVTRTRFTTLFSTTLKTCITQVGQNAQCQGRKKREAKALNENLMAADNVREVLLDSSQGEKVEAVGPQAASSSSPSIASHLGRPCPTVSLLPPRGPHVRLLLSADEQFGC